MKNDRLVLGWLAAAAVAAFSQNIAADPKPGDVAPAHIGKTLDGMAVQVTDFPGKAVVISYWATWCKFCVKELAMLNAVQTSASDRVQVVAVNIEPVNVFKKVAEGLSRFQILSLYDPDRKGRKAYGVEGIPHMIIVGKDGRIESVNIGYTEKDLDGIVTSINRAIGAVPPT